MGLSAAHDTPDERRSRMRVGGGRADPLYFGHPDRRLFGWYHAAHGAARRDVVVVLCPPLGDEYSRTGAPRALRHWAEQLAVAGVPALRFDYFGTGDSAGAFDEGDRVRACIDSIDDAVDFARARSGARHVVVAGIRLGATFALAAATRRSDIDALILCAPVQSGRAFLREARALTRLAASTADAAGAPDGGEHAGGFFLSAATVASLEALNPLASSPRLTGAALVVARDDGARETAFGDKLAQTGMAVECAVTGGYVEMMADAHAAKIPERLIDVATRWVAQRYTPLDRRGARPKSARASGEAHALTLVARGIEELPVRFGDDGRLFGVLARPSSDTRRVTGVLLLNAGSVHRVGPNRLYVTMAREWAALGYRVLRMDVGGIGDSASPAGCDENHPYPAHAMRDIAAGVAELRAHGASRVVVGGVCSGAHASFHAGLEVEGVNGLMLINPIVFYWKPSDPLDFPAAMNHYEIKHYRQALRRWRSWARLLSGRVDPRYVARVGVERARTVLRARMSSWARRFGIDGRPENPARDLALMSRGGMDVFLLFSSGEPGHDYLRMNYGRELRRLERTSAIRLRVVEGADHTFTSIVARRRAAALLTEYLVERHP